jgi:diaminopimelate epimerase
MPHVSPARAEPRSLARAETNAARAPRRFWKMHGLGNDFVVLDTEAILEPSFVRALADRRRGVGADQVLTVRHRGTEEGRPLFAYGVYNADGTPAEQCGNGLRCLARWAVETAGADGEDVRFTGPGGRVRARVRAFDAIELELPPPALDPTAVPFRTDRRATSYILEACGMRFTVGAVATGNPHVVLRVEDADACPVAKLGPAIERHPLLPKGANVGFMQILSPRHIRLRVHERGTGETQACGSGSCAAVVWGRLMTWLADEEIRVDLPGGTLHVSWAGEPHPLRLRGPAEHVFSGELR